MKAQSNLGVLYMEGCGAIEQNLDQALRYYKLAAEQAFPNVRTRTVQLDAVMTS